MIPAMRARRAQAAASVTIVHAHVALPVEGVVHQACRAGRVDPRQVGGAQVAARRPHVEVGVEDAGVGVEAGFKGEFSPNNQKISAAAPAMSRIAAPIITAIGVLCRIC